VCTPLLTLESIFFKSWLASKEARYAEPDPGEYEDPEATSLK